MELNKSDILFYHELTNKDFENYVNDFADNHKSNNPSIKNSISSTVDTTTGNKNNNNSNDNLIKNYLLGDKLPVSEINGSKNFLKTSTYNEKILHEQEKNKKKEESKNTLTPEKVEDKKQDSYSHVQGGLNSSSPSLIIAEIIFGKKLYAVYQNLINREFSLIYYNLKEVKNPNNSNYLIIKNHPQCNNTYMLDELNYYYSYLFSLGPVFGVIDLTS